MNKGEHIKIICKNRKAFFNFEVEDTFEVYLVDCHISPYVQANRENHEPLRERKLLLHKREIKKLTGKVAERGYSLIPLRMYFKNGKVKVEMGLARGKKNYDKRETIKKKDQRRELERMMKFKQR